jgi:hypothetical protein
MNLLKRIASIDYFSPRKEDRAIAVLHLHAVWRKVRAPQDRIPFVKDGRPDRADGKCHREYTALS